MLTDLSRLSKRKREVIQSAIAENERVIFYIDPDPWRILLALENRLIYVKLGLLFGSNLLSVPYQELDSTMLSRLS